MQKKERKKEWKNEDLKEYRQWNIYKKKERKKERKKEAGFRIKEKNWK